MSNYTIEQFDYNGRELLFNENLESDDDWKPLLPSAIYSVLYDLIRERDQLLEEVDRLRNG